MKKDLGWKTITGIIFAAITTMVVQLQPLFDDVTWMWTTAILGGITVVLTGVGIIDKVAKAQAKNGGTQ